MLKVKRSANQLLGCRRQCSGCSLSINQSIMDRAPSSLRSFFPCAWWSLYWFVLDQVTCSLAYYKSPKNPKRKGIFMLDGTQLILTYDKLAWVYLPPWLKREQLFGIMLGTRSLTLCCYYPGEAESWIEVMDLFRPEYFDKRIDAADRIVKCMRFSWAYKEKRREEEMARKAAEERNILETYLPVHSKLYGLGEEVPPRGISPEHLYPYTNIPFQMTWSPYNQFKNLAYRAKAFMNHIPPSGTPSMRLSGAHQARDIHRRYDGSHPYNEMGALLNTLSDTRFALNALITKQQEQAAHIQNLQEMIKDRMSESGKGG